MLVLMSSSYPLTMHLTTMASPTSASTGELLESTTADIESGTVPTTPLSPVHPFRIFWQAHLTDLTTPGFCDPIIDAYVAVFTGDPQWRVAAQNSAVIVNERRRIRNILRDNPPNVVVVDQHFSQGYGFHHRSPSMWPFIGITKFYIDKWAAAQDNDKLALGAVLDATVKHEIGHWFFSMVGSIRKYLMEMKMIFKEQRVGTFREASQNLPEPQGQIKLTTFPSPTLRSMDEKHSRKSFNATWVEGKSEAGNFVEYQGHGGIIIFNNRLNIGNFWNFVSSNRPCSIYSVQQ